MSDALISIGLATSTVYQSLVRSLETVLRPVLTPLETRVESLVPPHAWEWLTSNQSVHSAKLPLMNPVRL